MSTSSPTKSSLAKLLLQPKPKTFRVMVLGQAAVGKSALVVRFMTRRFIGEYAPNLENIYPHQAVMDNETINFQILDSAAGENRNDYSKLEANIRWAQAFILMYSVTDQCSFDDCHRLKFLINYTKRRYRLVSHIAQGDMSSSSLPRSLRGGGGDVPVVVLVGNKSDLGHERMVPTTRGHKLCKDIGAVCFHEISVRESIQQCWEVFHDARRFWRVTNKCGGRRPELGCMDNPARPLGRAASASEPEPVADPVVATASTATDVNEEEEWADLEWSLEVDSEAVSPPGPDETFRTRACTESALPARPVRPRAPPTAPLLPPRARRTSVAMKGDRDNSV